MPTCVAIVAEARSWIGTRFQHQQHAKGLATDCNGLVYGVGIALGLLPDLRHLAEAGRFAGYARLASAGSLVHACDIMLERIDFAAMQPGDVLLMKFIAEPQHVGILGDYLHGGFSLIHAYAPYRKVIEHRLDQHWMGRAVHAYRYRGVSA